MNHADALLRLALIPGLGPLTATTLLAAVTEPAEIFDLGMERLQRLDGIGPKRARAICDPAGREAAERARCAQLGVTLITRDDPAYPEAFTRLHDAPLALWLRGELQRRDQLAVAVVGPRRPSAYGHRQADRLAGGLARLGATVVSGLARGVDTIAHEAALKAKGRTVAVLGSGLGRIYPEENLPLVERIVDGHGCVLSEFPLEVPPAPGNFPRRNRLVAALSLGVLVIEAELRSGALITARLAGELGREVMALPGPVDRPESQGTNQLLRDGATLITSLDDILEELAPLATLASAHDEGPSTLDRSNALNSRERQVYSLLDDTPRSIDDLARISNTPTSQISATLISLEIRRCARKAPGGYVRAI
jgi:DNA processing protein